MGQTPYKNKHINRKFDAEYWDCNDCNDVESEVSNEVNTTLILDMRMLWEQHIAWTRMTIISIAAALPDQKFVIKRLLRNAKDMGAVLNPFYENEIAAEFNKLLKDHLVIAAELVKASKAGDSRIAAKAERQWYQNADEIAAFLASINPNWSEADLKEMLYEHLQLTKDEAVARLSGNYAKDIAIYDRIENQALLMADALSAGIAAQFPEMFSDI